MGRRHEPLERKMAKARGDGRTPGKMVVPVANARLAGNFRMPPAPRGLGPRGRVEWRKVWTAGQQWLQPEQDYHWVEMIARSYSDIEVFRKQVEETGLITKGYAGQDAANPMIAEIRKCEATIQKCLSILGFSPTDRARLGFATAKAENAVREMMRNKAKDAGKK